METIDVVRASVNQVLKQGFRIYQFVPLVDYQARAACPIGAVHLAGRYSELPEGYPVPFMVGFDGNTPSPAIINSQGYKDGVTLRKEYFG